MKKARIIDYNRMTVECPNCKLEQKAFFFGDKTVFRSVMQDCENCGEMFEFYVADFYKIRSLTHRDC